MSRPALWLQFREALAQSTITQIYDHSRNLKEKGLSLLWSGMRMAEKAGAQEAENIGKDETDKDLSGRFPLWPSLPLSLLMECYLSRQAPKPTQRKDGHCNDLVPI